MPTPKSITAAQMSGFATTAARAVVGGPIRIIKGPPIWGYILKPGLTQQLALEQATAATKGIAAAAKEAGLTGLRIKPSVVIRPDRLIAGFIEQEFNIPIKG